MSETGNLDANLILRQCKLDLISPLMVLKCVNPNLGQGQIAKELGYSSSTSQRYRTDGKMPSHYKSNGPNELERPQKT